MISFTIPIRTISEANRSRQEHWGKASKRVKGQREAVGWCWQTIPQAQRLDIAGAVDNGGLMVKLIRVAPRDLDDDNLARSLKAVRDQVAKQLAIDDADPRLTFQYGQERGTKAKEYGVRVEIEPKSS
jgi:hypothetical protein